MSHWNSWALGRGARRHAGPIAVPLTATACGGPAQTGGAESAFGGLGAGGNAGSSASGASHGGSTSTDGAGATSTESGGASSAGGASGAANSASAGTTSGSANGGMGGAAGASTGLAAPTHTARALGSMPGAPLGYWEYLPKGYGDGSKPPLLIFWHGGGEKGDGSEADLQKVLAHGPPQLISQGDWPVDRPFVVLSPQHNLPMCKMAGDAHRDFLAYAAQAYDVDPKRIYQTGLSCGALGTADFLARYGAQQLAAAVLIAGDITPAWDAQGCALAQNMALWALHGGVDATVSPLGDSTDMPKLMGCPPPHKDVQFDLYPGVDHDAWTRTYDLSGGHDIYSWLLQQTK